MNESIGNSRHLESNKILTSEDINNMLKTTSKNEVLEWLNKNFVGLMKIFPTYDMYYINVLNWCFEPDNNFYKKSLSINYDSYWREKKYTKNISISDLSLPNFQYAIKIVEKKGKKNLEVDPFEEEYWGED